MPDLKRYRQKRDPESTPEPFGGEQLGRPLPAGAQRLFVVQQHAARNMHWDLRLEIDGVLASWAIPRGPSLDPAEKRLAVRTEDHPIEYADFEGVIPDGNYGAGAMIVWDRGSYHTVDGRSPAESTEIGKLDLYMDGHKLRGRFALVRTRGEGGKQWLLIRKGDPPDPGPELVEAEPGSVFSGLEVAEVGRGDARSEALAAAASEAGARRRALPPEALRPMLASASDAPFTRDGWLFEPKYDGARVLVVKDDGAVRIVARSGRDATHVYPEIARAAAHLPPTSCVLDGEVVAPDAHGKSSFERLQRRFSLSDPLEIARAELEIPLVYYAFDLLQAMGYDLRGRPLLARKALLEGLVPRLGFVRYVDHVEREGEALFDAAAQHELEGVIGKRADSKYSSGARSKQWLKFKVPRRAALAIVGAQAGKGSRARLGSLMLAWHDGAELRYAGNVGSGLDERTIDALLPELESLAVETPPCTGLPEPLPAGTRFVEPRICCEVRYTEVTGAGRLRHPSFEGLRGDVTPADCVAPGARDEPVPAAPASPPPSQELKVTRPEKVFWPEEGYTKGDLLAYYEAAWDWIGPYLHDRPVVLTRYPDGIDGKSFFQKNAPEFTPGWVERRDIEGTDYFICNELRTLLYVINSGAIPLHVWSSRVSTLERPDWLILDLDPKEAPFRDVVTIARFIHSLLRDLGAACFAKTSGQDGLHVMVPLGATLEHDDARALGEVLARAVVAELPEIATVTRPVAARGDKVYVDYGQNGRGRLIAAPFSVRPRAGAPVSTPLAWSQVTARLDPARFTIKTAIPQMRRRGDSLRPVLDEPVDVHALLQALTERL
jgi:bifunctional non-homologous end joining protein LigD